MGNKLRSQVVTKSTTEKIDAISLGPLLKHSFSPNSQLNSFFISNFSRLLFKFQLSFPCLSLCYCIYLKGKVSDESC